MTWIIRPATSEDIPSIVDLLNEVNPREEQTTREMFRHEEGLRRPESEFSRLLALEAGRVVAMGQVQNSHIRPKHKFWIDIAVHPDARRQGIGSEFEHRLREFAVAHGSTELTANIKANDTPSRGFLESRDYREAYQRFEMELDVSTFDWSKFGGWRSRLGDLRLFSMAEAEEGGLERLFELSMALMVDVPHPEGMPTFTVDDFRRFSAMPNFRPDGFFVLADGDRWIGLSGVLVQEGRPAYTAFTAVDREYRGRGLATLMKLATIEFVQSLGLTAMRTTNDTVNYPMVAVNEKLGYRRLPARVAMKLMIGTGSGPS
ncbi:MAG: GNAT family N-acetyltransferase [bacterium]